MLPDCWRDRDGAIAIIEALGYVILASEALRIGSEYTEVSTCQSVRGGQTLMLRFPFRTERLRFPTADLAMVVETRIDDIVKRHRARSTTLAVGEDEQFVRCTYLGGAHLPLEPTARYDLLFRNYQLEILRLLPGVTTLPAA